ncbi:DUF1146 domain-containing protein [Paenibacillus harenae]|uniref:Integral membrane protein (TIGR02327 family) n=1 Tax=Paenibacillus harenae TaxID=306543 RepID=A0ABT9U1W5_PAEHA|nr:DUF1146 domain-containing protein [Paenibacillus harenae]MDQ0061990.1 putative integral membrane protein (TIGR02327 family) [Paenibacillus harenae]MDQ0113612.1 putative integral membrane protein (TIGR02327 family) [Paenibacillus harenae]
MDNYDVFDEAQRMTGITGLFSIIVVLVSIMLVWTLLQEVKWETFFKHPRNAKARMFQVVVAVILGHLFAKFILEYWSFTTMLRSFVE